MARINCSLEKVIYMLQKKELVEVAVIARKVNVSDNTVRRWINEGKVEGYKIGGRWYVKKKSLEEFILNKAN